MKFTTLDNQSWANVHVYIMQDYKKVHILLFLECVLDDANSNNMIQLIIEALTIRGTLSKKYITKKLVSFGVDKVIIFQGTCNGVIVQIQKNYAPHKFDGANYKTFILNFEVGRFALTIIYIFCS
jgi:hypothetical protein